MFDPNEHDFPAAIVTACWVSLGLILAIAVASLLNGCAGATLPDRSYTPNDADRALFTEIERRWAAAGLPSLDTERCAELAQYMRVVVANDEELGSFCHRCPPGNCPGYRASSGCTHACGAECFTTPCVGSWPHCWGTGNSFLGGHENALIVVHESQLGDDNYPVASLIRHGYLHYLVSCSGLVNGSSDPGHRLQDEVWQRLDTNAPRENGSRTGATAP